MITPVARRRPWKLAQECVSLDHLSGGRFVLPVGLGWAPDPWFGGVGEEVDIRARASRLDEGLAIIDALWTGEEVTFSGDHYRVDGLRLQPRPVQRPRIPIWVVGAWPSKRSLRRASLWDGVLCARLGSADPLNPEEIADLVRQVNGDRRSDSRFDVVVEGLTPERDPVAAAAHVESLANAGVTWYLEGVWLYVYETPGVPDAILRRVRKGPPS